MSRPVPIERRAAMFHRGRRERAITRRAVTVYAASVTTLTLTLGCCVPLADSAQPLHAPPIPKYLRGLGRPSATGYNFGDGGIPYNCDFWKLGRGKVAVEYCIVDNHVAATLTEHKT